MKFLFALLALGLSLHAEEFTLAEPTVIYSSSVRGAGNREITIDKSLSDMHLPANTTEVHVAVVLGLDIDGSDTEGDSANRMRVGSPRASEGQIDVAIRLEGGASSVGNGDQGWVTISRGEMRNLELIWTNTGLRAEETATAVVKILGYRTPAEPAPAPATPAVEAEPK